MAKTRLDEYWNYYLRKNNRYKTFKDRSTKYDRDMAYNDYKKAGGKRKKLIDSRRISIKKSDDWKVKIRRLIKLKSTSKTKKDFYRWCLKHNKNPFK